jgi:hypothetical protein
MTWDDLKRVWDESEAYFIDYSLKEWQAKGAVHFAANHGPGYTVFMHRSTIPDCGIQVTKFDADEQPWGHMCFDTPEEAIEFIWKWDTPIADKEALYYDFGWDGDDFPSD